MGLDTTHDCWHGAYSAFMGWRNKLSEIAGYGQLIEREGFEENYEMLNPTPVLRRTYGKLWPDDDILVVLLRHSDCEGFIATEDCEPIAHRLTGMLSALERAGTVDGHIGNYADKTRLFIRGLMKASRRKEKVTFH